MKNIERIKVLRRIAKTLRETVPNFKAKTANSKCDKYDLSFQGDNRFPIFKAEICLAGYTGYFGDSNCSSLPSVDSTEAARFLRMALNKSMETILEDMAIFAEYEAAKLTGEAKREIEELRKLIEDSETDGTRAETIEVET